MLIYLLYYYFIYFSPFLKTLIPNSTFIHTKDLNLYISLMAFSLFLFDACQSYKNILNKKIDIIEELYSNYGI